MGIFGNRKNKNIQGCETPCEEKNCQRECEPKKEKSMCKKEKCKKSSKESCQEEVPALNSKACCKPGCSIKKPCISCCRCGVKPMWVPRGPRKRFPAKNSIDKFKFDRKCELRAPCPEEKPKPCPTIEIPETLEDCSDEEECEEPEEVEVCISAPLHPHSAFKKLKFDDSKCCKKDMTCERDDDCEISPNDCNQKEELQMNSCSKKSCNCAKQGSPSCFKNIKDSLSPIHLESHRFGQQPHFQPISLLPSNNKSSKNYSNSMPCPCGHPNCGNTMMFYSGQ